MKLVINKKTVVWLSLFWAITASFWFYSAYNNFKQTSLYLINSRFSLFLSDLAHEIESGLDKGFGLELS